MNRFMDNSLALRDRYAAGLRLTEPTAEESAKLIAFAKDHTNDRQLRLLALAVHADNERIADAIFEMMRAPEGDSPEFIEDLVDYVSRWFFVDPTSRLARDGTAALQTRLTDPAERVRVRAFEGLMSRNDTRAVELATNQLRDPETRYLPDHLAVHFLRRADPRAYLGVVGNKFKSELEKPVEQQDEALLVELVKTMSIDAEYQKSVATLAQAEGAKPAVQRACLESLSYYRAPQFPEMALEVLNRPDAELDLQLEAARGMVRFLKLAPEQNASTAEKFREALQKLNDPNLRLPAPVRQQLNNYRELLDQNLGQKKDR